MVEDTWYSVAIPILEYCTSTAIQARRHCRPHRRDDGHRPSRRRRGVGAARRRWLHQRTPAPVPVRRRLQCLVAEEASLGERGVRVVGACPSDDPYDLEGTLLLRAQPQAVFVNVQTSGISSSSGTLSDAARESSDSTKRRRRSTASSVSSPRRARGSPPTQAPWGQVPRASGQQGLAQVDQLTDRGHYGPGTRSGPTHAPSPVVQVVVAADTAPSEGVTTAAVGEVTRTAAQDIGEQGCPALIVSVALGSHNAAPTPSPEFSGIGRFEPPPSCLIGTPTI
jgi:hypothetical protein